MADKTKKTPVGAPEREWLAKILRVSGQGPEPDDLVMLLPSLCMETHPGGAAIVEEGQKGTDLFFLYKGSAAVRKNRLLFGSKEVVKLKPGEFFGEVGFLVQAPRSASVVAQGEAKVLKVACAEFQRLLEKHPAVSERLETTARERMQKLSES